jgi:hypothetical protein
MSFDLRLTLPQLDEDAAQKLQRLVFEQAAWPLHISDGWVSIPETDGAEDLFTHTDKIEGRFVWQSPAGVGERLARTFELLGRQSPTGFSFHAAWYKATPDREREVSVAGLAGLARVGGIDEDTLYRVQSRSAPRPGDR